MIIGAMRVKNESRWIKRAIQSILPVCDWVFVLDDHSEDNTRELALEAGARCVAQIPGPRVWTIDEARDKNWMMDAIKAEMRPSEIKMNPRDYWILMIDGDEELVPSQHFDAIKQGWEYDAPAYTLRIGFLWNREDLVRVDGVYRHFTRPSLFHMAKTNGIFKATGAGKNFHCGSVPFDLRGQSRHSGAILKHYGYLDRADRERKFRWYNEQDPLNHVEDQYRHLIIGDLLPSDACTKHAGPLELQPWEIWKNQ